MVVCKLRGGIWQRIYAVAVITAWPCAIEAEPMDQAVFTDFENISSRPGVPFDVGTSPNRATFSGNAFSGVLGISELYRPGGVRAWMVNPNATGIITFETNAAEVEFFARARSIANGNTVITALDDDDAVVGQPVTLVPGQPFQLVAFSGNISRILVENKATGGQFSSVNAIDDLGFTPRTVAPEPPCTLELFLTHADGTLTMDFLVGSDVPVTWTTWLIVNGEAIPLWSLALPDFPMTPFSLPIAGFPDLGVIGMLTILEGPEGIVCWDFDVVDTGP